MNADPSRIRNSALHAEGVRRPLRLSSCPFRPCRTLARQMRQEAPTIACASDEIWPWLALTLLGLLLVENFLANRTAA